MWWRETKDENLAESSETAIRERSGGVVGFCHPSKRTHQGPLPTPVFTGRFPPRPLVPRAARH